MKKLSVKLRITMWITVLVAVLTVALVTMAMGVSSYVADEEATNLLENTVRSNLKHINAAQTTPKISEDFLYYHNGVTTLVYSKNQSLIAGQLPVNFKTTAAFENGMIRTVESGTNSFFVMDIWLPSDWDNGVWIRGIIDVPDNEYMTRYLLHISAITLPLFTVMAALGSWFVIKKSFKPLDRINAAAEAINEAKDLSGRINLPQSNDEFSRLADNFDSMFERLERSFETEKQFTSDASHELRTPIAIIKGACEYALKYDETEEERRETLDMIHRQTEKMSVLIQQLLSMTRMEQGTEKLNFEKTDMRQLILDTASEQKWDARRIDVQTDNNAEVNADKNLMSRLLVNLVENAFKYGDTDEKVQIILGISDGEMQLAVKDKGRGISSEHIEKIWHRFYQADSARSSDENSGSGLGLAIVKQIAELHGGYMTVESEVDKGSIFTLHIPLAEQ
ncbi:MAG: HAMP domain-containing histidine kinase [Oscillospiraceae bacterium]|nr:HAMP domain-containing histidine kinase [Oscillospiraceae bacterium]